MYLIGVRSPPCKLERILLKASWVLLDELFTIKIYNICPFIKEAMDYSIIKRRMFLTLLPLLRFPKFCLEGRFVPDEPGLEYREGCDKPWKPRESRVALVTFAVWGAALS